MERHEFYEELAGERDDNRGGGDDDDGEGEGGGGGTISNGGGRSRGQGGREANISPLTGPWYKKSRGETLYKRILHYIYITPGQAWISSSSQPIFY